MELFGVEMGEQHKALNEKSNPLSEVYEYIKNMKM
jgi:hypothetical protein